MLPNGAILWLSQPNHYDICLEFRYIISQAVWNAYKVLHLFHKSTMFQNFSTINKKTHQNNDAFASTAVFFQSKKPIDHRQHRPLFSQGLSWPWMNKTIPDGKKKVFLMHLLFKMIDLPLVIFVFRAPKMARFLHLTGSQTWRVPPRCARQHLRLRSHQSPQQSTWDPRLPGGWDVICERTPWVVVHSL